MKFLLIKRCIAFILLCIISSSVFSSVMPSETEFELGGKKDNNHPIRIYNQSDAIAYVKVDNVVRVDQPGTPNQKEVLVNNTKNPELMVTPSLLIIQPHSDADVVVVDMVNDRDTEQAYYFKVEQVQPPATKGVTVSVNYRVLVHAEPKVMQPQLLTEQKHGSISLKNQGNVRYALRDVKWCKIGEEQNCIALKKNGSFRIYPHMEKLLQKKPGYDLHFVEIYPDYHQYVINCDI